MARYDYRCTSCDTVFEVEHGMRERPEITCPSCGAPCTRVLNASGIVLKGSGFYNTDQRGKKGPTEGTSGTGKKDEASGSSTEASSSSETGGSSRACEGCAAAASAGGSCPAGGAE